ncbi:hypothetical protein PR048_013745 [Dryococelus australis]|uniref:Uncharacterized protein n=1 Tax=Dryococelus australis TaxID=614101 RepID=A0ABQ9HTW2_9NEOP|nr:hypothetical protein PR048_013745 [Dryococelus australis]
MFDSCRLHWFADTEELRVDQLPPVLPYVAVCACVTLEIEHGVHYAVRVHAIGHARGKRQVAYTERVSEENWVGLNIEVLRANEVSTEQRRNERAEETGNPRESPKTTAIRSEPSKYRNRIRLEIASQKQSIETHSTSYDLEKRRRLLASYLDELPAHRIFESGNHAGVCRWSAGLLGDLPFPPPFHSGAAPCSPQSLSSDPNTSLLTAVQISSRHITRNNLLENDVQLSPSTVTADSQCAVDIGIFVPKTLESSTQVIYAHWQTYSQYCQECVPLHHTGLVGSVAMPTVVTESTTYIS